MYVYSYTKHIGTQNSNQNNVLDIIIVYYNQSYSNTGGEMERIIIKMLTQVCVLCVCAYADVYVDN